MEKLNAENIINEIQSLIKALKDCGGWVKRGNGEGWFNHEILADALALITSQEQRIKGLTEDNERLKAENETLKIATNDLNSVICDCHNTIAEMLRQKEAYTIMKMHSMLCEGRVSNDTVVIVANQIAKEMLKEE